MFDFFVKLCLWQPTIYSIATTNNSLCKRRSKYSAASLNIFYILNLDTSYSSLRLILRNYSTDLSPKRLLFCLSLPIFLNARMLKEACSCHLSQKQRSTTCVKEAFTHWILNTSCVWITLIWSFYQLVTHVWSEEKLWISKKVINRVDACEQ